MGRKARRLSKTRPDIYDVSELVDKLHEMREYGATRKRTTLMMHLFGCIFDNDIDRARTSPIEIERHYKVRYDNVHVSAGISDGRNLREVMTVDRDVERRWRSS